MGILYRLSTLDFRPLGDKDAVKPVAAGIAADLAGDNVAVGGEEGEGDGLVAIHDQVQVGPLVGIRAVNDLLAGDDAIYQRLAGLGMA